MFNIRFGALRQLLLSAFSLDFSHFLPHFMPVSALLNVFLILASPEHVLRYFPVTGSSEISKFLTASFPMFFFRLSPATSRAGLQA